MAPASSKSRLKKVVIDLSPGCSDPSLLQALSNFDKDGVIAAHRRLQLGGTGLEMVNRSKRKEIIIPPNSQDKFCRPLSMPMESMTDVTLSQLNRDTYHDGKVLRGKLCTEAFTYDKIVVTALEDVYGRVARLLIRNTVESNWGERQAKAMYPEGAPVVINEPCLVEETLKGEGFKGTSLWVTNPAAIYVVTYVPHIKDTDTDPGMLKELGNKEFQKGNYMAAAELYTRCIEAARGHDDLRVAALSNRALANLKMENYHQALEDANQALGVDDKRCKSHFRRGRALLGLKQYRNGSSALEEAVAYDPRDATSKQWYDKSVVLKVQSTNGTHNVAKHYIKECEWLLSAERTEEDRPEAADFVAPVEVKMTSDGKGRGLFTKADLKLGDLVVVSNAVAVADESTIYREEPLRTRNVIGFSSDFVTRVVTACLKCPRTLAQVYSLDQEEPVVPDMELYKPNWSTMPGEEMVLDVCRIEKIINSCGMLDDGDPLMVGDYSKLDGKEAAKRRTGLWTLPGFINHSCLPNASVFIVGNACYVFAAKDIPAGTELLRPYNDVLTVWSCTRRKTLPFECKCARCMLEMRLEAELKPLVAKIDEYSRKGRAQGAIKVKLDAAQLAVKVEKAIKSLGDAVTRGECDWLRVSFCEQYAIFFSSWTLEDAIRMVGSKTTSQMPHPRDVMQALLKACPGAHKNLVMMRTCSFYDKASDRLREAEALHDNMKARCGKDFDFHESFPTMFELGKEVLAAYRAGRI